MNQQKRYLREFLKRLPAFQAFFRSIEAAAMTESHYPEPILDLGCGDGNFTEVFLGKGKKITGIDLSETALKSAAKRALYQQLVKTEASALPFADQTFGMVLANSSLEHINHLEPVLKESFRVLRKGGWLLLSAPSEKRAAYFLGGRLENDFFKHRHCWSGRKWEKKLREAGFRKISYRYAGSRTVCWVADLLSPLGFVGYLERKIFGHYLGWRQYWSSLLFWILKGVSDRVEGEKGAVIIVKAEK